MTLRDSLNDCHAAAGFKTAFEYIQDYVSIYGLKMWQENCGDCAGE